MRVSCSMDGHTSEYSWTLEHKPLDGSVAYLSDEKDTFILQRNVSAALMCTARNRVCSSATTVQMSACPVNITSLSVLLGAVFVILASSIAIYCWNTVNNRSGVTENNGVQKQEYTVVIDHGSVKRQMDRDTVSEVVYKLK
ncbi:hypothetical protein MATL_G00050450 [Megalops atlanticus]|uniref:Ig-like domain-containing protein n=1 Tax=Megalops atlanticus TaxID=7932 RepID=A0A9D3QAB4_MEGAT|nr:hypothetical protein MATL_G00050450 [Megalops atlanticus]